MSSDVKITISAVDKTKSAFGGLTGSIGKLGKIAAGVAVGGIAALAAGLAFSVKAAMEAEEIQAQLNAVLKSTGGAAGMTADSINKLALELSQVTRFEDDAIVSGQNILLTFTKIGQDIFPQATEAMLDMSTALGQDLQSSAIQLGKALNDPVQGMTALRRVGVSFTEDQVNMVKAMVDTGDVMGAQKFILQELQTEFGGSARAAGETFAGQLEILKNSLGNVGEAIGMKVIPLLTPFVEKMNGLADAFFEAGLDSVEFQDELANLFGEEMAEGIHNVIVWLGENLPKAIQTLSDFWTGVLNPAIKTVWEWISGTLIPFFSNTVKPWLDDVLPKAIGVLSNFWEFTLKPAMVTVWEWMSGTLWPFLMDTVFPWLNEKIPAALATLSRFWEFTLKPAMMAVYDWMTGTLMPFFTDTVSPYLRDELPEDLSTAGEAWKDFQGTMSELNDWMEEHIIPLLWELNDLVANVLQISINNLDDSLTGKHIPAWKDLNDYFEAHIIPILWEVSNFFSDTLGPAISGFITGVLEWLIERLAALNALLDAVLNRKLPGAGGGGAGGTRLKQFGGPVSGGMPYIVGEAGPELFVPHQGGTIVNNFNLTANYQNRDRQSLAMDIKMLAAMYG